MAKLAKHIKSQTMDLENFIKTATANSVCVCVKTTANPNMYCVVK